MKPRPVLTCRVPTLGVLVLVLWLGAACAPTRAQDVGQCVRIRGSNPDGVPRHAQPSNSFTGQRFPNASVAKVMERAADGHWLRLRVGTDESWVVKTYVEAVVTCVDSTGPVTGGATPPGTMVVGTWNLEWLKNGKERGFPEFQGPQGIPERTDADYQRIADIIRQLDIKILLLQEINGFTIDGDEEADTARSVELDRLVAKLGVADYEYVIGTKGSAQRCAILYDTRTIHLDRVCEGALENTQVQNASLFARQPLLGFFRVVVGGVEMNDLVVVGVHLASGQSLTKNHDQAMDKIESWIQAERAAGGCIPSAEKDILIAGDLNASRFDSDVEQFWNDMEAGPWDVLADSNSYPPTRLSGNPPEQRNSRIDYIIVSRGPGALAADEVTDSEGVVHAELVQAAGGGMSFRRGASDHLPVTIQVRIVADTD